MSDKLVLITLFDINASQSIEIRLIKAWRFRSRRKMSVYARWSEFESLPDTSQRMRTWSKDV